MQKIYFSPEVTSGEDMITLTNSMLENKHTILHMSMHSSSLIDHATGLMDEKNACQVICQRIKQVVDYLNSVANVQFCTLNEAAAIIQHRQP